MVRRLQFLGNLRSLLAKLRGAHLVLSVRIINNSNSPSSSSHLPLVVEQVCLAAVQRLAKTISSKPNHSSPLDHVCMFYSTLRILSIIFF
jgi:hypothetical protein